MGVMLHSSGVPCVGGDATYTSGFSGPYCNATGNATGIPFPESKYYDTYLYGNDETNYSRKILGDATGEMGPFGSATYGTQKRKMNSWYQNEAWFIYTMQPWFSRGGTYYNGFSSGSFAFAPK